MNVKVSNLYDEQKLPLLHNMDVVEPQKNLIHRTINQTCKSTSRLAHLLPTGTVLSFQLLSPIFTNQGKCDDSVTKLMTLSLCGASHAFYSASLIASEARKVTYVMVLPHLKACGSLMDQKNFHMNLMQNIN
jgi:hypothetical protein